MIIGCLNTPNFSFMLVAPTRRVAEDLAKRVWTKHCKDFPLAEADFVSPEDWTYLDTVDARAWRDNDILIDPYD